MTVRIVVLLGLGGLDEQFLRGATAHALPRATGDKGYVLLDPRFVSPAQLIQVQAKVTNTFTGDAQAARAAFLQSCQSTSHDSLRPSRVPPKSPMVEVLCNTSGTALVPPMWPRTVCGTNVDIKLYPMVHGEAGTPTFHSRVNFSRSVLQKKGVVGHRTGGKFTQSLKIAVNHHAAEIVKVIQNLLQPPSKSMTVKLVSCGSGRVLSTYAQPTSALVTIATLLDNTGLAGSAALGQISGVQQRIVKLYGYDGVANHSHLDEEKGFATRTGKKTRTQQEKETKKANELRTEKLQLAIPFSSQQPNVTFSVTGATQDQDTNWRGGVGMHPSDIQATVRTAVAANCSGQIAITEVLNDVAADAGILKIPKGTGTIVPRKTVRVERVVTIPPTAPVIKVSVPTVSQNGDARGSGGGISGGDGVGQADAQVNNLLESLEGDIRDKQASKYPGCTLI